MDWRNLKFASVIAFVSIVVVVYTGELLIRWSEMTAAVPIRQPLWGITQTGRNIKEAALKWGQEAGIRFDVRDRIEVTEELRQHHINAVAPLQVGSILAQPSQHVIKADGVVPIGGVSQTFTVMCNESGRYVTYESDEHGFRNPKGAWNRPQLDLAILGESFAGGYCVPDGATFSDYLRRRFPATLNLGVSGESSLLQLAAIREYLAIYKPKAILWIFSEGIDLPDLSEEKKQPLLMRYLDPGFTQHLSSRQQELDKILMRYFADVEAEQRETARTAGARSSLFRDLPGILKLWELRNRLTFLYGEPDDVRLALSTAEPRQKSLFGEVLTQARDLTKSWGGELYFVYLPSWNRYKNHPRSVDMERTAVLNIVGDLGIPVIDLHPVFQATGDPLSLFPYRRFGHYNEEGNRLIAGAIFTRFARSKTSGKAPSGTWFYRTKIFLFTSSVMPCIFTFGVFEVCVGTPYAFRRAGEKRVLYDQ